MSSGVGSTEPPRSEDSGFAAAGAGKFQEIQRDEVAMQRSTRWPTTTAPASKYGMETSSLAA